MNLAEQTKRIHPLVAVAATAVAIFSLVGIAAITGILPSSHGTANDASRDVQQSSAQFTPEQGRANTWDNNQPAGRAQQEKPGSHVKSAGTHVANDVGAQRNPSAVPVDQPTPVAHKAPQNSPIGIGVGAVVGGVLGNQVGSGDGKTLATILGAVGGGYVGNEIAKKNQQ
jgi:uncharacterized protein YcfJ